MNANYYRTEANVFEDLGDKVEAQGYHSLAEEYWMVAINAWDELAKIETRELELAS